MNLDFTTDTARQRYLDLMHRYFQGRIDFTSFRRRVRSHWAQERTEIWHNVWKATRIVRCQEREALAQGVLPVAHPADPRRFPRMLDRLCMLCIEVRKEEPFRASAADLLAAYRCAGMPSTEAKAIDYPPRVSVFERPLPSKADQYPCTVDDIRRQLALVPEFDLEGLWAVGLATLERSEYKFYGTYYRWFRPMRRPVILLHSIQRTLEFKLRRSDPGYFKRWFRTERGYGIQLDRTGCRAVCRWSPEALHRYVVQHVLMHEIGHHVDHQQRWRSGFHRWLRSPIAEQFAEDYALRFNREGEYHGSYHSLG